MSENVTVKSGICYMCTPSCPMKIHVSNGRAVKVEWGGEGPVNPCPRWRTQLDFIYHPDRLQYPLKRTGPRGTGQYIRISWDEALDTIAANLQKVKDTLGPESAAFWISYTKEPRPYFHRLVHAFGSPNYCTESSNCFSATWIAANLTYGPDKSYFTMSGDMNHPSTQCKLVWGTAYKNSRTMDWMNIVAAKKRGMKLIVVDPRRTDLAAMADIYLQVRPGTDGALALGMINIIINEGLYDKEFVEKWTIGFSDLKKLASEYPADRVEQITGVPAEKIRDAAVLYATAKPAQLGMSGDSTTHHINGVQNHRAIILLPALTGNYDVTGGNKVAPPTGLVKNDITLHDRITKMPPGAGSQRFPIWTQRYREMQSNALADQMESGRPYPIKALFSCGLNKQYFANSHRMAEILKKLDFIAVSEYFLTAGAQLADIVLPIASWWERPILKAEFETVRLIEPAIAPVGECRAEWDIYSALAKRWGFGDLFWQGNFEKCVDYILEPSKITSSDLKKHPEGIRVPPPPLPDKNYEQTGFQTPSGKVEIACRTLADHGLDPLPTYREPPEGPIGSPDLYKNYPLVLSAGARVLPFVHSQYHNIERLHRLMPDPLAEINPADADSRGIKSGDWVVITSPRASIKMKALVTDSMMAGVISIPHHWPGEANANALVDDKNFDPISGFMACKSQLCQISKA